MKQGYSLVGVLAALLILMLVLVPLLHVHGRLYQNLDRTDIHVILQTVEDDIAQLLSRQKPFESTILMNEPFFLKRSVERDQDLWRVTYHWGHNDQKTHVIEVLL